MYNPDNIIKRAYKTTHAFQETFADAKQIH